MDAPTVIAIATIITTAAIGAITVLVTWLIGKQAKRVAERQLYLSLIERRTQWVGSFRRLAFKMISQQPTMVAEEGIKKLTKYAGWRRDMNYLVEESTWLFGEHINNKAWEISQSLADVQDERWQFANPLDPSTPWSERIANLPAVKKQQVWEEAVFDMLAHLDQALVEYIYTGDIKLTKAEVLVVRPTPSK